MPLVCVGKKKLNWRKRNLLQPMEIRIPYGQTYLTGIIPGHIEVDFIDPPVISAASQPLVVVEDALDHQLGDIAWPAVVGAQSVAIAINDKTRPVPHHVLLPPLMKRLEQSGIPDDAITFYIAVGAHPPMTLDEFHLVVPATILERYRVVSHNCEEDGGLVLLGETARETPVWVNRNFHQSDFKIVVGNIEPHQFVGFSGGVKTAAIGLAGLKTIKHNHALLTHPDSQLGVYETNPARQDVEEIGKQINIHLALNVILNQDKQVVQALAGDPVAVMRAGIPLSRQICQAAVSQKYDVVIASPGGHPKDINVYQAQKGLSHAAHITRPHGTMILAAACPEGAGSPHYENWMAGRTSYADVLEQFQAEGFRIGPHKAYLIARDASKLRLLFYSQMDDKKARALLLNPFRDFQNAIDIALADFAPDERVGIMTHASSTIPDIEDLRGVP